MLIYEPQNERRYIIKKLTAILLTVTIFISLIAGIFAENTEQEYADIADALAVLRDLVGLQNDACVDSTMFGKSLPNDNNQREGCNCTVSVDIGNPGGGSTEVKFIVCLAYGITPEDADEMAEYAPGRIVFADACFDNSEQKSNVRLTLKDKGIAIKAL
ncbi:MAG: DUF1848 domain-containing protein [Oscillospiraceae bacterium]|nr:DUF1848 domain-containing protein [Oscillospiraceae bacterium]